VNFLSTYSDKKSCNTSTALQNGIARFVSDSVLSAIAELLVSLDSHPLWCDAVGPIQPDAVIRQTAIGYTSAVMSPAFPSVSILGL